MARLKRKWDLPEDDVPEGFMPGLGPLIRKALWSKGFRDEESALAFIQPGMIPPPDPFLLKEMDVAVQLVLEAVKSGAKVGVFGDYDADGVTSTALLTLGLRSMGVDVIPHIPHRIDEGYGLNEESLQGLYAQGVGLVVSCDCGTNSAEVVAAMKPGQKLVITDHHLPAKQMARPAALVNPHQEGDPYPEKEICGAGVVFKLLEAVATAGGPEADGLRASLDRLSQLAAIGTIADVMPMTGESRLIVKRGLEWLEADPLPGLEALFQVTKVKRPVTASTVSFQLAPRINAAGRMGSAMDALSLLLEENLEIAMTRAEAVEATNESRKIATSEAMAQAEEMLAAQGETKGVIFLAHPEWPLGIVGLIAGRLADEYSMPVFVMGKGENGSTGSARSVPGFNVVDALSKASGLLERFGGHEMAAGFGCKNEDLAALEAALREQALSVEPAEGWRPRVFVDAAVPLSEMRAEAVRELGVLEPFGAGNAQPVFLVQGAYVVDSFKMGKAREHLKVVVSDHPVADGEERDPSLDKWDVLLWRRADLQPYFPRRKKIDALVSPSLNEFRDTVSVQFELQDVRVSQAVEPVSFEPGL